MQSSLKILLIFLLFSVCSYSQPQQWKTIAKATDQSLWKCSFVDTLNGWAVGDSGTIFHTTNGGYNWVAQNSHIKDLMVGVFFLNKRLGWVLAWSLDQNFYGSYILKTTNGGIQWDTARYPVPDTYIRTVYFLDSLTGFLAGSPAFLMKTTNAGASWYKCGVDTSSFIYGFPINRIRFFNDSIGVCVGGVQDIAGVFWKTTNRGEYWIAKVIGSEPLIEMKFFSTQTYLAMGGDFEYGASVVRTTNGGINWDYRLLELFGVPSAMSFRNNYEGWVSMGYLNKFLKTNASGVHWEVLDAPDSTQIFDLAFLNTRFGIGVGLNGAVIKYKCPPMYSISGNVKYNDNNQPVTNGYVKAFKFDASSGNILILDSTSIQPDGSYVLGNVPQDSLDIGVFPNSSPPNDWVISYYPGTIYWNNAVTIYPTANMSNINILAVRMLLTSSNNSIGGNITRFVNTPFEILKDAIVYAKNGNTIVNYAVSDENGNYQMQSLPSGNIKIIATHWGFVSDSTIKNMSPTSNIDSVNFTLHLSSIGIKNISSTLPKEYKLFQNYPNPFNPITVIKYQIKESGLISLKVYDLLGREVAALVNQKQTPGVYEVSFDGSFLSTGVYFYRLEAGNFTDVKKLVLIK